MTTNNSTDTSATAQRAVASGPLVRQVFPRNPERDEQGNAVLYPGMPRFDGVAALYNTAEGELVILAPNFEALERQVQEHTNLGNSVSREKCILTNCERLPNTEVTDAAPQAQQQPNVAKRRSV